MLSNPYTLLSVSDSPRLRIEHEHCVSSSTCLIKPPTVLSFLYEIIYPSDWCLTFIENPSILPVTEL